MELPDRLRVAQNQIKIVPRYSETDQAGVVHHSVYPVWLEMGRCELLRENKVAYKDMEKAGIFFVVAELNIKYKRPAMYDDSLELKTECSKVTGSKIEHTYTLTRPGDQTLIAQAQSVIACVGKDGRIRRIPEFMYPG